MVGLPGGRGSSIKVIILKLSDYKKCWDYKFCNNFICTVRCSIVRFPNPLYEANFRYQWQIWQIHLCYFLWISLFCILKTICNFKYVSVSNQQLQEKHQLMHGDGSKVKQMQPMWLCICSGRPFEVSLWESKSDVIKIVGHKLNDNLTQFKATFWAKHNTQW